MKKIIYSGEALKELSSKNYDKKTKAMIYKKLEYLAHNYDLLKNSKKITELVGQKNIFRYTMPNKIRAIYRLQNDEIEIFIIKIGKRKNIYDDF